MSNPSIIIRANKNDSGPSFNMTPLIDIIFLLILFFVAACQFIDSDAASVNIPDNCDLAKDSQNKEHQTSLAATTGQNGTVEFTLNKNRISADKITNEIDAALSEISPENRIVTLRVDKNICFGAIKDALAGVSRSKAQYLHLAVLKNDSIK